MKSLLFLTQKSSKEDTIGINLAEWKTMGYTETVFFIVVVIHWGLHLYYTPEKWVLQGKDEVLIVTCLLATTQLLTPVLRLIIIYMGIKLRSEQLLLLYGRVMLFCFPLYVAMSYLWLRFILGLGQDWASLIDDFLIFALGNFFTAWYCFWILVPLMKNLDKNIRATTLMTTKFNDYFDIMLALEDKLCFKEDAEDEWKKRVASTLSRVETYLQFMLNPLELEIDKSTLLAEGHFSLVYKGIFRPLGTTLEIVGKTGKEMQNVDSVVKEMKIALLVGDHPHFVKFYGISYDLGQESFVLVFELCANGSLDSYLEKLQPLYFTYANCEIQPSYINLNLEDSSKQVETLEKDLKRFTSEICTAMIFLVQKKIVHGDLASRNVLLTNDRRIKLTDFGLSNKLYNYQNYTRNFQHDCMPWRWMPPEALDDLRFSEKSDVWAFGVTLWEIFCLGRIPFSEVQWSLNISQLLKTGELRLGRPILGGDEIFDVVEMCCAIKTEERPHFVDLPHILASRCDIK